MQDGGLVVLSALEAYQARKHDYLDQTGGTYSNSSWTLGPSNLTTAKNRHLLRLQHLTSRLFDMPPAIDPVYWKRILPTDELNNHMINKWNHLGGLIDHSRLRDI